MTNPFAVTTVDIEERGVFGDFARRIRGGFLYRVIEMERPYRCRFTYNGWWFRQQIQFDDEVAWQKISWLTIRPNAEFRVPASIDPLQPPASIEIGFTRGLMIRRFRIWIDGEMVYDEVN